MFKILKDTRRRAVESILETVGVAEVTNDPEFDALAPKFDVVIAEMNQGMYIFVMFCLRCLLCRNLFFFR